MIIGMENMTLEKIAAACSGRLAGTGVKAGKRVTGVVIDSRKVERDFLFIATRGEKVDGHSFIGQVMEKGAAAVVCEREPAAEGGGTPEAYILVRDSFAALQDIAAYYRSTLHIPFIGITGSVGKTSTKEFIASVLGQKFNVLKTEGNYNNEIGVPLTVLQIRKEHSAAVLEMGINHFGEMHRLSRIAQPNICVMTNIGQCHLEFLGSREGILKAKSEIFDYMDQDGTVLVNGDDDLLAGIKDVKGKETVCYGLSEDNAVYAKSIKSLGLFGSSCMIHMGESSFHVKVPLPGEHMIYNALAAAAAGRLLGLTDQQICEGIESVEALGGRNHIIKTEKYILIDDCYNANPVSMKAGITMLAGASGRKAAVLGDMGELGTDSVRYHEEVGRYTAQQAVDILICIGELSAHMRWAAAEMSDKLQSGTKVYYFSDIEEFFKGYNSILKEGDTILIKASHSMGFEAIVKALSGNESY